MKLRLRNLETRETLRVDVASPSSLHQLQQALSASLFPPPPSASSLRFSLNAKDELGDPSPYSSLLFLGVAAGDLIYFSLNPNAFSTPLPGQGLQTVIPVPESSSLQEPTAIEASPNQGNLGMSQEIEDASSNLSSSQSPDLQVSQEGDAQKFTETLDSEDAEMAEDEECEIMDVDGGPSRDLPEPYFLSEILREELGEEDRSKQKLLILALHAVLLKSGFVAFDPVSGREDRRRLSDKWISFSQTPSLFYTLHQLLHSNTGGDMTDKYIVLKFQRLGNFVSVYGSLAGDGSGLQNICLDDRFQTAIKCVLEKAGNIGVDKASGSVFDFWKVVKDELALPLLVNLCDKAGLALPACFARLPTELKLKILESLSGVDLASMELVSKEMKYLVSDSGLSNKKFASMWESKMKRTAELEKRRRLRDHSRFLRPRWRDPYPFGFPRIIGDDDEPLPGLVPFAPHPVPLPFAPHPAFPRFRRTFRTDRNLGGDDI